MYDDWYHRLVADAIHRPYEQTTRDNLAKRLRHERRQFLPLDTFGGARKLACDIGRISWPIKLRPNGRYT